MKRCFCSGHIVDVAWDPSGRFNHSATVPPGKFVEVCGRLDSGMKVRWEFDAVAPMDFNIHYHVGKDAVFPAKQAQVAKESPSFGRGDSRAADNRRPGAVGQALGTRSSKPPK